MKVLVTSTAAIMLALTSLPAAAPSAKAALKSADGKDVGSADLTQTPAGVLIKLSVKGLPAGEHAFHVHGVGKCEPPFTSAGGHFNPGGKKHGMMAAEGHHAGDMPNLHIPPSGEIVVEILNTCGHIGEGQIQCSGPTARRSSFTLARTIIKTDPTGDAGGRIACGVIQ